MTQERMTAEEIALQEKFHSGSSWTRNESFDKNGYFVVKNLWDSKELTELPPENKGQYSFRGKTMDYEYMDEEKQVNGSTSRYWFPPYRPIHSLIRRKIEEVIGRKLYNTYFYDRFYNPGQDLSVHCDRPACEISVTLHVSTNIESDDKDWPIWVKTPDTYTDETKTEILVPGENRSVVLQPGDGMIYKGCERPHWREPLPKQFKKNWYRKNVEIDGYYYHQIFFHYVLADGQRSHFAYDSYQGQA